MKDKNMKDENMKNKYHDSEPIEINNFEEKIKITKKIIIF